MDTGPSATEHPEGAQDDILYFAQRPSQEFDEVMLQADYAARATINFYRFRQLGGGRENKAGENKGHKSTEKPMKLGRSTGRGIHYVSDHPQVRMFNFSVIILLVLFESAANAYFFARQSEFGISGGMFQAAAVSLANVSTSYFIIGFWGLRHASMPIGDRSIFNWDRRNVIRGFGVLAIILGVIMVLLVNLSAAHYRNILDLRAEGLPSPTEFTTTWPRFFIGQDTCDAILQSDIGQSIGSAATNAMCRPFALHSLDAMVLFALGLAISALAAFEGRRSDSPFPASAMRPATLNALARTSNLHWKTIMTHMGMSLRKQKKPLETGLSASARKLRCAAPWMNASGSIVNCSRVTQQFYAMNLMCRQKLLSK